MTVEICANSFQSAKNAQDAGAHRIELCSELSVGGITPSYGLIKQVVNELSIKTFVLIRPRSGDFTYSDSEFEIIKQDIKICKDLGVSGIVSGVLNSDNSLDVARTKTLVELSKPMSFTFHRAFDGVPNPTETLEQLIALGVDRILTSGQEDSAIKGITLLKQLQEKAKERLIILAGSGVNPNNAKQFKAAGFLEIHASASKAIVKPTKNKFFDNTIQTVSDKDTIQSILNAIQ
ncbi:copper homeostasis protein CutC [Lacinutrix salivirga]